MNKATRIKCEDCNEYIIDEQIKEHIEKCEKYVGYAQQKVFQVYRGLSVSQLKFLEVQLKICQFFVKGEIQQRQLRMTGNELRESCSQSKIPQIRIHSFLQEQVQCTSCHNKYAASYDLNSLFYVQECWHLFCIACIWKYIHEEFSKNLGLISCPSNGCAKMIKTQQLKVLMGEQTFMKMYEKGLQSDNVECIGCKSKYIFEPGNIAEAPKQFSQNSKKDYVQNRFKCLNIQCRLEQCKACKVSPYHIGKTCEQFDEHNKMKKCRYCEIVLNQKNILATNIQNCDDICNFKECKEIFKTACKKKLPCGHSCSGVSGQIQCLPCLNKDCAPYNQSLLGQKGDDFCNICWTQTLLQSPCIRSKCGHIAHLKCLKKRYEIRWHTPRILFDFCLCPLCKKWLEFPIQHYLHEISEENGNLFLRIQQMAVKRLKFEELMKDPKLTDMNSPYYEKPKLYAMAIYAYFQCYKCKNPYFGGRKNCADMMNENRNQGQFNPKELICPNCCDIPIENCPKHGNEFISFKCKFCCSHATFYCWGSTHFCNPCHERQSKGDYLTKYPINKLPKCKGVGKCPIGGNHNGNGIQKSLGCAQCRNYVENRKDF